MATRGGGEGRGGSCSCLPSGRQSRESVRPPPRPTRDPRGAWFPVAVRGGQREGETQTRTARGKQRRVTTAAWGSSWSPRAVGEPGPGLWRVVGVLARKEKRDGAAPAPRNETAAGGSVPDSPGQFFPLLEGARDPLARGRRRCGSPSRPAEPSATGAEPEHGSAPTLPRSTAEAAWPPHGLSAGGSRSPLCTLRPRRPRPAPALPRGPGAQR